MVDRHGEPAAAAAQQLVQAWAHMRAAQRTSRVSASRTGAWRRREPRGRVKRARHCLHRPRRESSTKAIGCPPRQRSRRHGTCPCARVRRPTCVPSRNRARPSGILRSLDVPAAPSRRQLSYHRPLRPPHARRARLERARAAVATLAAWGGKLKLTRPSGPQHGEWTIVRAGAASQRFRCDQIPFRTDPVGHWEMVDFGRTGLHFSRAFKPFEKVPQLA